VLKFLLKSILISGATVTEIYSMALIMDVHSPERSIILATAFHSIASILAAAVLSKSLVSQYQTSWLSIGLFFFLTAFFMPILGILGLMLSVLLGLRNKETIQNLSMSFNKIRALPETSVNQNSQFRKKPTMNLENLLRSQNPETRMSAVYATLKLEDKNAIPLLRIALRDPVDDIRLLAYALIDRKEQRISERIEHTKQSLENNNSNNLHLYRSLVKDYWELAHLGLVEGETLNYVLNKVREYLETALQLYPNDRGLHLQNAKLLLQLGNIQAASDEFKLAENLGIGRQNLLLYYAEIAFKRHRYNEVKQYMGEISITKARTEIQASNRFWLRGTSVVC
jgi:tetratricopeptide (TPR) repeat protein